MKQIRSSKSGRYLIEFLITLFIFTLTSSIVLQLFVQGSRSSADAYALNRAVVKAQAITEEVLSTGGDGQALSASFAQNANGYVVYFDSGWNQTDAEDEAYLAQIGVTQNEGMLVSDVSIQKEGKEIYAVRAKRYLGIEYDENAGS